MHFCGAHGPAISHTMLSIRLRRSSRTPALLYPSQAIKVYIEFLQLQTLILIKISEGNFRFFFLVGFTRRAHRGYHLLKGGVLVSTPLSKRL